MNNTIPQRCHACGRYCDGCAFSEVYEAEDPLAPARGIVNGLLAGVAFWLLFVGFLLLIYFNVSL